MLRRSILQLNNNRVPLRTTTTTQVPSYLSSRRAFSVSQKNEPHKPHSSSKTTETKSNLPKIIGGGLVVVSAFAAYYYGALDLFPGKKQPNIGEYAPVQIYDNNTHESSKQDAVYQAAAELSKTVAGSTSKEPGISMSNVDHARRDVEPHSELSPAEDSITKTEADCTSEVKDTTSLTQEKLDNDKERDLPDLPQRSFSSDDVTSTSSEESFGLKSSDVKHIEEQDKALETTPLTSDTGPAENEIKFVPREVTSTHNTQEVVQGGETQKSSSLLDDYYLKENAEDHNIAASSKHKDKISKKEDAYDGYISEDGILVLDFLQAIHAAEKRQAELDAHSFNEEKKAIKEKYEKELRDARARELMYVEREAILDKELNKERIKAAAAIKSLQERLEEKLRTEIEEKEKEAEQNMKKILDIAEAELAAAIANEKASQIDKMSEANLHINALCMAFYARSEEARQSHSIHKLSLGALALEDALGKGLPVQKEIEALHAHLEGIDKDSFISLVLSSLPEDTQKHGTDTLSQLNHKFDSLKGTLRHFSLIPPGGGGILAHTLAHMASWLKVKEVDESGDGIESIINRVESLLAQGKLCEAANALEHGVKGSQAAEVVDEWVRSARNRAIAEQALTVMQSYATSISLT